jgi:hypothetical protein
VEIVSYGFADPEVEDHAFGAIFRTPGGTARFAETFRLFILRLAWV